MRGIALGATILGVALWLDRVGRDAAAPQRALEATEARVRGALARPPVRATTLRGRALTPRIVELSGVVEDAEAALEAVRRARAVPGVEVVIDRLETFPPRGRPRAAT